MFSKHTQKKHPAAFIYTLSPPSLGFYLSPIATIEFGRNLIEKWYEFNQNSHWSKLISNRGSSINCESRGGLQGEGEGHIVLFYLLPPLSSFPQCESSNFPFCSFSGDGDMAVSNTVGSNTFDVLLCLGVPWLIKSAAWNAPIEISSRGLFVSCFFIVGSVAIAFFVLYLNSWVLNQKVGCFFIFIYFIFLGTSVSMEMFVFGRFRLPMCSIEVWIVFFDGIFHLVLKG